MPSPFPGMDPYLESPSEWSDFHATFIPCWRRAINELLPVPYHARIDVVTNLIEIDASEIKLIKPDAAVLHSPAIGTRPRSQTGAATIEPVTLTLPMYEEVRERRIEIHHHPDDTLVAVLELLSPWNKATGAGNVEYTAKRLAVIRQSVHLVELDLLLGGRRLPMTEPLPAGDYYALISRSNRRPKSEVYAWTLRDRLPQIPLPLLDGDPDILLDLAAVFATTYDMGGYARGIKYGRPPAASIPEIHRQWVAELAKSATPG